ncbi:MAG: prefoldin subunit alpha [Candidatus Altiarchaeota archaeon]|nr:prefoldin subunit alpha [Candidatus Altiarchaeota archaeon]
MDEEKNPMNDSQKLQLLLYKIQSQQGTLQELYKQLALVERSLSELEDTIAAIEEIPKTKEGEALVPVGLGIFVKAELLEKNKFLVSVGSDIFLDKTAAEAKEYLEAQKGRIRRNHELMNAQIKKIQMDLNSSTKEAEGLYVKLQGK